MFERLNGHDSEETPAGSMAFFRETIGVGEDRFAEYEDHEAADQTLELESPFLGASATSFGATGELSAPEIAALCEMTAELKDGAFRESLEQLAEEALEIHAQQLAGEYGDHEVREANALRVLEDHFRPIATQAEQMLDRFFERLEQSEAAALSPGEIERIAGEVLPTSPGFSPAAEQFFGTLLRKASKLVDMAKRGVAGAVKLASTGLAAVGKLALGPLLEPLKKLATFLLRHVARYALDHIPPPLRPLAQQLSDRLFQALGAHEAETEDHAHAAAEVPASVDAARLEAEFDLELAQLMLTPDANEVDHLVANYGEAEAGPSPLAELDQTRAQFANALQRLEPGQSAGPVMEQFLPALLWPAAKAALAMMGRPKFVGYIARLLDGLMKPMIGEKGAGMLAPAIADAGLRAFGLEMSESDPRAVAAEAMAAAVEETVNSLSELPPYVMENETLLETAVREAFETAAATYFPPSVIRPDLRETAGRQGVWTRMPAQSSRKRYARYTETPHVAISPRVAAGVPTFGGATLRDHLRDRMNIADGRTVKTNIRLYQVTPGTTAAQIARAEGFHSHDLHPLTREAAGALLGHDAGLGSRHTPARYLHSPHRLHVRQRLYYVRAKR